MGSLTITKAEYVAAGDHPGSMIYKKLKEAGAPIMIEDLYSIDWGDPDIETPRKIRATKPDGKSVIIFEWDDTKGGKT